MSYALAVFVIGALAAAGLGIADFFGARASKNLGPITAAFVVQVVGTVAFCLCYPYFGTDIPEIPFSTIAYALGGAVLMAAGVCTLYMAFELGPVSLASPLSAAYPLVTTAVSVVVFRTPLSFAECVAIVVIVVGIMAASGLLGVERSERRITAGPRLALLTTLLWGLAYPLLGQAIDASGWQVVTLIQFVAMVPVLGIVLVLRRNRENPTPRLVARTLRNPYVLAAGVLQMLAILAINFGFGLDPAAGALVVATSATYPVITMFLALWRFAEHANKLALAGAGLTVAGVLILHSL